MFDSTMLVTGHVIVASLLAKSRKVFKSSMLAAKPLLSLLVVALRVKEKLGGRGMRQRDMSATGWKSDSTPQILGTSVGFSAEFRNLNHSRHTERCMCNNGVFQAGMR